MILKACPFCGDRKQLTDDLYTPEIVGNPRYWVNCGGCGATGPEKDDLHEAEEAWNARTADTLRAQASLPPVP